MLRKRLATLGLVFFVMGSLVACQEDGTQELSKEQVDELHERIPKKDVKEILGRPKYQSDNLWTYAPKKGYYRKVNILWDDRELLTSYSTVVR